jgi:hypothetical protein
VRRCRILSTAPATIVLMDDTWASRDLPVLTAIVEWRDRDALAMGPTMGEIADVTGFDVADVLRATKALDAAFILVQRSMSDPSQWFVAKLYPPARRAVGQWPSGESLVEQLVAGLRAAELTESDPAEKTRLRTAVDALSGIARDVVVQVATSVVSSSIGHV